MLMFFLEPYAALLLIGLHLQCTEACFDTTCNRTNAVSSRAARHVDSPAPIDCKLRSWTSWAPCDSCTETTVRFQSVERHSQFGGLECVHSQWEEKLCPSAGECEPADECGEMYTCPESGRCISQSLRCNGERDCRLGDDEDECEEVRQRESKCVGMLPIPGAQKATMGYNVLANAFVDPVLDHRYFGGRCEYVYNGEWRRLTYDAFCEHLYYNDEEKYFRKPYNFLSYRLKAHSTSEGSHEYYSDAVSLLDAQKTELSANFGRTFGVQYVEVGVSVKKEMSFLNNITQYNSKDVGFIRLRSRVETAEFKVRSGAVVLDEDMLLSLMELPLSYEFGSYSRFINQFGTHYVTQGIMGGELDYVVVVNKEAMEKSKMTGQQVGSCLGVSLGLAIPMSQMLSGNLKVTHESCGKTGSLDREKKSHSEMIRDVIGFVKGGTTGSSAEQLAVRNANSYRRWGKSLKYNPAVIRFEAMPIYELVRFSTAAAAAETRLSFLKRAWHEYMEQWSTCRCTPCRNNGVPVLTRTACSCLCREGYSGSACETTHRSGPTHGSWSCWSSWSSCVSGTRRRRRDCNNPAPKDNGFPCQGTSAQTQAC